MNDVPTATAAPPASASSATPSGTGTMSSPRLAEFNAEVEKLKVTGGGANSEKLGAMWGIGLTIVGFVISVLAGGARSTPRTNPTSFVPRSLA